MKCPLSSYHRSQDQNSKITNVQIRIGLSFKYDNNMDMISQIKKKSNQ